MPIENLDILLQQLQYPGSTYVESAIIRAFLRLHGQEYDRAEWNVRLGDGAALDTSFDAATRELARQVTTKRADMVLYRGRDVLIVEVKVRIGLPAMGQLLGYQALWRRQYPTALKVELLVIGRTVDADVLYVLANAGIAVETFIREADAAFRTESAR